jgi:hypothetical protein
MAPWNMRFIVFFVDPRPFDELLALLQLAFGGAFEVDLEYKALRRHRATSYAFGLGLACTEEADWETGRVYSVAGASEGHCWFDGAEWRDVGFHACALLNSLGLARVMTFEEFQQARNVDGS